MSGFSPDWLALREPADHAARNGGLARAAAALLSGSNPARILDLGCGAGSNVRGFSPFVDLPQHWTLVDHDARLLDAARRSLLPPARESGGRSATRTITVRQADLVRDLENLLAAPCDLVTAAAFFDLVSGQWIERFCAALAARRLPLYAVLTYDGIERWHPAHPLDAEILGAFIAHQGGDKGFGPSAGRDAHGLLRVGLARRGYVVREAQSPWRLDQTQLPLIGQLADGIASAACETGQVGAADAESWRRARHAASACQIGHMDLLAVPR